MPRTIFFVFVQYVLYKVWAGAHTNRFNKILWGPKIAGWSLPDQPGQIVNLIFHPSSGGLGKSWVGIQETPFFIFSFSPITTQIKAATICYQNHHHHGRLLRTFRQFKSQTHREVGSWHIDSNNMPHVERWLIETHPMNPKIPGTYELATLWSLTRP